MGKIQVPHPSVRNHKTHHEIVGYGHDLMELVDNTGDLGTIASATRINGVWTVTLTKDPGYKTTHDKRADAIGHMIHDHVDPDEPGFATFVPDAVAGLGD